MKKEEYESMTASQKSVYNKLIKDAKSKGDDRTASYWKSQLEQVKQKIENINQNRKRNEKQFRKAN